ncbi:MAG: hypothetical protein KDB07_03610 [Planctomycetes bacterium]|nr:hypothetical protein [Planctomycetota bacterium]
MNKQAGLALLLCAALFVGISCKGGGEKKESSASPNNTAVTSAGTTWGEELDAPLAGVAVPVKSAGCDKAWAFDGVYITSQPAADAFAAAGKAGDVANYVQLGGNDHVDGLGFAEHDLADKAGMSYLRYPVDFSSSSVTEDLYDLREVIKSAEGSTVITGPDLSTSATVAYIWLTLSKRASRVEALETAKAIGMSNLHRAFADRYLDQRVD